jgi:hypothetical protein
VYLSKFFRVSAVAAADGWARAAPEAHVLCAHSLCPPLARLLFAWLWTHLNELLVNIVLGDFSLACHNSLFTVEYSIGCTCPCMFGVVGSGKLQLEFLQMVLLSTLTHSVSQDRQSFAVPLSLPQTEWDLRFCACFTLAWWQVFSSLVVLMVVTQQLWELHCSAQASAWLLQSPGFPLGMCFCSMLDKWTL